MFAPFMVNAWEASSIVAVVAGVVGFFVVLRGASFAAHALPNGAFAGAAGASLIGASTLLGLGSFSLLGAITIAHLSRRARSDVATALTIVLMLGLGALFLSRSTRYQGEIFSLLFGEVLGVNANELVPTAALAAVCIVAVALLYRPLLLTTVAPETAQARGISPRAMELSFLCVVALVTTMAVPVVGSLLIFSLLVAPAAAARCLTARPLAAVATSIAVALATVWAAIALSFESDLPIGFFVGAIGAVSYGTARVIQLLWGRHLRVAAR
jgi:zinc/manganese transport system permease protein